MQYGMVWIGTGRYDKASGRVWYGIVWSGMVVW